VRIVIAAVAALSLHAQVSAQINPIPDGMAAVELERSRTCVGVLAQVEALDEALAPLAERAQRLVAIGQAIALEDERVMESLDSLQPVEAQVHAWFVRDQELAQRYVATLAQQLVDQRAAAREEIKQVITDAVGEIQAQADEMLTGSDELASAAAPCDGAIFVRSAVLEACEAGSGKICDAAAGTPAEGAPQFRFVESPEDVWDIQEMRPWTLPGPLRAGPNGQLDGARTIGFARAGNVVVSVAFSPLLRDREGLSPEESAQLQATNDSLGIESTHPDVLFAPALGIRATLPNPLAGESSYVLHFGPPEEADVVWSGVSGTGEPIERTIPIGAAHVGKLQAGEPITLTALRAEGADDNTAVFAIELTAVNQANASQALLGYMGVQLGRDLAALLRPRGSE
jgi:hypothetical protein